MNLASFGPSRYSGGVSLTGGRDAFGCSTAVNRRIAVQWVESPRLHHAIRSAAALAAARLECPDRRRVTQRQSPVSFHRLRSRHLVGGLNPSSGPFCARSHSEFIEFDVVVGVDGSTFGGCRS